MVNINKEMPKVLKFIAQSAMDEFYQNYRSDFQFFDLEDFITNVGQTVSSIYQKYYEAQYKDLRGERKDEVVIFDTGMLAEQILDVTNKDGILFSTITQPVMTFMYDQNSTGIQIVQDILNGTELERTSVTELWQLKYMPKTNRIFFYSDINKIGFVNKGDCNLKKVRVLYVPSMYEDAVVADTVADQAIQQTILEMRQLADKRVVKKSLDGNDNLLLEAEIDKKQLA